jgi:hypothetical protein
LLRIGCLGFARLMQKSCENRCKKNRCELA